MNNNCHHSANIKDENLGYVIMKSSTSMNNLMIMLLSMLSISLSAQLSIDGILHDETSSPIMYSNIVLYASSDSTLVKVETSDSEGRFSFKGIEKGNYYLITSYIGYEEYHSSEIKLSDFAVELGIIEMAKSSVVLEAALIKAKRTIIEVKPDRMVFNVEGTINSAGDNAIGLLRKAPGVLIDNNNNITVLSKSGVLIYIDGKRQPLSGEDLTTYLNNLPAEQIDKIDIITNPGAKYEAEGSAGIIDIKMKRDEGLGSNGSISSTLSQGQLLTGQISALGNYKNKVFNTFGTIGYSAGKSFVRMHFINNQNNIRTEETQYLENADRSKNYRWGTDFFLGKNHTIGLLVTGLQAKTDNITENISEISSLSNPSVIDSVLIAHNSSLQHRDGSTYNLNYAFDNNQSSVNFDIDYARYKNTGDFIQPNRYYDASRSTLLTEVLTEYDTQVSIDIYTAKLDYETKIVGGNLGLGSKVSRVNTANQFLFYNIIEGQSILANNKSNEFYYDETVLAAYTNYQKSINENLSINAGVRVESSDIYGELIAFSPDIMVEPVVLNYTNYFPSAGLTYNLQPNKTLSISCGRRINRPDYNFLNPFTFQYSELSFLKGNEKLNPEIVNNIELGYTLNFRYNFKVSYSKTTNKITRLVQPDDVDLRANLITWENLAEQTLYGFNISAPIEVTSWWNSYLNINGGYMNNQANYGNGSIVDVHAFTYSIFQQNTLTLGAGITGEVSIWYGGPGIWGGVFEYDPRYSIDLGLQKKFFNDLMNIKLSASDISYQTGWSGTSNYGGLIGERRGEWDSRKVAVSISYNFGNSKVMSRQRSTGIADESKRAN